MLAKQIKQSELHHLAVGALILSEWTDYKPEKMHCLLHNVSDWFALKKS